MSTQAPINRSLVLKEAQRELELQIAGIRKIEDGSKQAKIDGAKEWAAFSWWKKYWSWCDSEKKWAQLAKDEYDWKHTKELRQRRASKRCAEGLIQLASTTTGDVMLSSDDANFLNIKDDS